MYNFHGDSKLTYASREKKAGFVNSKGECSDSFAFKGKKVQVDLLKREGVRFGKDSRVVC